MCGTTPGNTEAALQIHRRLAPQRARLALLAPRVARDVGDVAVLDASDGVLVNRHLFNLGNQSVRFSPTSSGYRYEVAPSAWEDPASAQPLNGLGDDDAREMALPFEFPFYGRVRNSLFIHSDGNLSFDYPDAASTDRSLGRMTAGPPRIAPLFNDLDPSQSGGAVRWQSAPDHVTVTWDNVREYATSGGGTRLSSQVLLYIDGSILFQYKDISPSSAVVGLSPGSLAPGTRVVSFSSEPSEEYSSSVVEQFAQAAGLDLVRAAQRFYETHDDSYDYLVFFNTLGVAAGTNALAVENTVRSYIDGIGDRPTDYGYGYGSPLRLQATLNMGPLTQYPVDPYARVGSRGLITGDNTMTLIGHEAGHRWLALASIRDAGDPSARPMLGIQQAHWSFNFNSEASLLEGNRIQGVSAENLNQFLTVATVEGYSPLDQYLMGFRAPEEVPPTFLVRNSTVSQTAFPQVGVSFRGTRQNVTVQDIINAEGARVPDYTVTQRRFHFGFVLLVPAGSFGSDSDVSKLETYRREFESYFYRVSGGRASADCGLRADLKLSLWPATGLTPGGSITASLEVVRPPEADLSISLESQSDIEVPQNVIIPAGTSRVEFSLAGRSAGVALLKATPDQGQYTATEARIAVRDSAELQLEPYFRWGTQLVVRVKDANRLPYPGLCLASTLSEDAGCTNGSGLVWLEWDGQQDLKLWLKSNEQVSLLLPAEVRP